MIVGGLIPIAILVLIVIGVRKLSSRDDRGAIQSQTIRRFFQYTLLFGLLLVSGFGLSGLLARVMAREIVMNADQSGLARNLSFVVVGFPLFAIFAFWTRKRFKEDSAEQKSFGWVFYLTASSLTSLSMAMFALIDVFSWATGVTNYQSGMLSRLIVWGSIWVGHMWVGSQVTPQSSLRGNYLLGSLIGLITSVVGLSLLLAGTISRLVKLGADTLYIANADSIKRGAVVLVVGGLVWFWHWIRNFLKSERDSLWYFYVLICGVGGGLVVTLAYSSVVLYRVLVWLIGDPSSADVSTHYGRISTSIALAFTGGLVWWYHQAVLAQDHSTSRTEVWRVYEYVMAGIGLVAAAGGVTMILVAIAESLIHPSVITGDGGGTNALLAAATLLVVGGPVWWTYWYRIEVAASKSPQEEHLSPTRRTYLFLLFGIVGIAAVITMLSGVYLLFDDIFNSNLGSQTLRHIRYALGILITTAAIAWYHWTIYRKEREHLAAGNQGPRFVLLIGPKDPDLIREIARHTGGRVQAWRRSDGEVGSWSKAEVISALTATKDESVVLIATPTGIQVMPVKRD